MTVVQTVRLLGITDHWYLPVQVEVPERVAHRSRTGNAVIGVDLGVTAAATLSSGEKIAAPRPLKTALRRLRISSRRQSRKLARAIADVGFHAIRRQLQYKSARYGIRIVLADRWYPSSKLCSGCGARNGELILGERVWTCAACGIRHDRHVNAAVNLQRLATGALAARTALPEASQAVTPGTAAGTVPAAGGEVTPVRHEHGQQDGSGQEEYAAHVCARF